jgi:hypothetical protein
MWRSSTKGTGPTAFKKKTANSISPQCRPLLFSNVFLRLDFMCCVEKVSQLLNRPSWNFLQPQAVSGFSTMTGIWAPMVMGKKTYQRLTDQDSSLRWGLICPSQLIGLKKRIRLGTSSSWDSRSTISVRSTESSTLPTIRCCQRRLRFIMNQENER